MTDTISSTQNLRGIDADDDQAHTTPVEIHSDLCDAKRRRSAAQESERLLAELTGNKKKITIRLTNDGSLSKLWGVV